MIFYAYAEYRLDAADMIPHAATFECEVAVRGSLIFADPKPANAFIFKIDPDKLTEDDREWLHDAWANVADVWCYGNLPDAMEDAETSFEPPT